MSHTDRPIPDYAVDPDAPLSERRLKHRRIADGLNLASDLAAALLGAHSAVRAREGHDRGECYTCSLLRRAGVAT